MRSRYGKSSSGLSSARTRRWRVPAWPPQLWQHCSRMNSCTVWHSPFAVREEHVPSLSAALARLEAQQLALKDTLTQVRNELAEVDLREGRVQDARDRLEASVRAFRKGGQLRAEAYFLGQWARARRLCGEPPERIRPSLVRALELGEISGDRYYGLVPEVELLLLRALSGSPPLDEARDLLARAAEQGAVPDPAGTLVDRAIARLEEAMHAWAAT